MSTAKRLHYSYAEYLRSLEMSALKLEYCDGVIYAWQRPLLRTPSSPPRSSLRCTVGSPDPAASPPPT